MGAPSRSGKRCEQPQDFESAAALSYSGGSGAISPHSEETCKKPEGGAKNPHEETELQGALLRSRIPACQKGKSVQSEEGIHGGQPTTSCAQTTSPTSTVKFPPNGSDAATSTRLRNHKLDTVFCEDGWEPAKMHRQKKQDSEEKIIQSSHRSSDKPTGSTFFKSKMDGRCYNCFSLNHLARSCHRPPRC
jgi:hypothetical protein